MRETQIYPIPGNCEIHFSTDVTDRCVNVVEYDTLSETKVRLTSWHRGHWQFHNPMSHNKFMQLCREHYNLRRALKDEMAYLRNPYKADDEQKWLKEAGKQITNSIHKTLKFFVI